jgi:hypothetical protein
LEWQGHLTPSQLSATYTVKIGLTERYLPKAYVLDPILGKREGRRCPHMYEDDRPCLFYPKAREWNSTMILVDTVVPWFAEWLLHYEIWLATDEWHGGGVHPQGGRKKTQPAEAEESGHASS